MLLMWILVGAVVLGCVAYIVCAVRYFERDDTCVNEDAPYDWSSDYLGLIDTEATDG